MPYLWELLVTVGVEVEHGADLLWGGGQHVQVVGRSLISKAAKVSVTDYLFVPFLSTTVEIF